MINWRKAACYFLSPFLLLSCSVIKGGGNEDPGNSPIGLTAWQQTAEAELWKPGDDIAAKMLQKLRPEGVVRIVSVHPSTDRYLFVAKLKGKRKDDSVRATSVNTDLWLVNKNGTGLRRLTADKQSHDPVWSPTGEDIAFISNGGVRVIGVASAAEEVFIGGEFGAENSSDEFADSPYRNVHVEYSRPSFSPNGKGIAVLAKVGTTRRVEVMARGGRGKGGRVTFAKGFERYEWNSENELVLAYGTFVFDWEHLGSDTVASEKTVAEASPPKSDADVDSDSRVSPGFLERMLGKLHALGVINFDSYSISPSRNRVVLAGQFQGDCSFSSDLWLINRDGSGLRRLTRNLDSSHPAWSPSEKEIAFTAFRFHGSVGIIDLKTGNVRWLSGLQARYPGAQGTHAHVNWGYERPRWSANGKVIAANRQDLGGDWMTAVDARSGHKLLQTGVSETSFAWNHSGELVIPNLGKFVFNWSSALFNRR